MKKKSLFLILILIFSLCPFVQSTPVELNVGENNELQEFNGQRTLWSNYTEAFYVFTHMGETIVQGATTYNITGYGVSKDGIHWRFDPDWMNDALGRTADCSQSPWDFDVAIDPTGQYIWVAWKDEQGAGDDVYIRKAQLNSGLTISWVEAAQRVYHTTCAGRNVVGYIDIELDSDGCPFVVALTFGGAATYFAYVRWSNEDNGTWVQDGQDFFDNNMDWNKGDFELEYSILSRLANGRMAWTVTWFEGVNIWYAETIYFNGANWILNSNRRLYNSGAAETSNFRKIDVVSYGDNLIGSYIIRSGGFQKLFVKEAIYNTGWTNSTVIKGDYSELVGHYSPSLSVDFDGNAFLFVLRNGGDNVNYTWRYSNYTWITPLTNWYDNNSQTFSWFRFTSSDNFWNHCPVVYQDNSKAYMELFFDYLTFNGSGIPLIFNHLNTTLYNSDGIVNDGWIFEGEVYDLVSYVENATDFYVNTSDSRHEIRFNWDNSTEEMWISVDPRDQFTIGLAHSEYERTGNITRLLWRFIPDRNIIDCQNEPWFYYMEHDLYGINATGGLGFNTTIYNLGGFVSYDFIGDAGKITGGDSFEIWAENRTSGASAQAETIFRKLQGVHLLFSLDVEDGDCFDHHEQTGYVEMGVQFRYNQTWVDAWYYHLLIVNGAVDPAGTPGKAWIVPQVEWHSRSIAGTVTNPRDDLISAYPECGDEVNNERTEVRFWVDLWFNRMNASTVVGGRVNSYYFGMDQGGFLGWSGWGPVILNETSSMYFDNLRMPDGNITDSLDIELVKFWVNVTKTAEGAAPGGDCDNHRWALRNYEILTWKIAPDRMQGIDTPIFVETKSVEMPSTGFLQPLYRAIDGLANSIWMGALGFQKILWGAMDSFFAWAGFGEGFFSRITAFLMTLPEIFGAFMEFMPQLFEEMAEIITSVFSALVLMIPMYTISVGIMIETIIDYWHILSQILNGQLVPFDIIRDIQAGDWINFGLTMLPTYEIFGIIFDDNPGRRAEQRMNFYSKLFGGLIGFLKDIASFMQQAIQTIFDIIPG